jgi:hypothetical protein
MRCSKKISWLCINKAKPRTSDRDKSFSRSVNAPARLQIKRGHADIVLVVGWKRWPEIEVPFGTQELKT